MRRLAIGGQQRVLERGEQDLGIDPLLVGDDADGVEDLLGHLQLLNQMSAADRPRAESQDAPSSSRTTTRCPSHSSNSPRIRRRPSMRGVEAQIDFTTDETFVVRRLCERARNAGGRDLERVALAEGDERAADLDAAFVIDAVGVVDEHPQARRREATLTSTTSIAGMTVPSTRSTSSAIASVCRTAICQCPPGRPPGPGRGTKKAGRRTHLSSTYTSDCGHERTSGTVARPRPSQRSQTAHVRPRRPRRRSSPARR